MIVWIQILIVAFGAVALIRSLRSERAVRRDALLEGAAALRRRAATKWEKNPNAAIEDQNCALVLEQMAGAVPKLEIRREVAA